MKPALSRTQLATGLAIALIVGLVGAIAPFSLGWVDEVRLTRQKVEHRMAVLHHVQELLLNAETGQRGFVITGKEEFLEPYHTAVGVLPREVQRLALAFSDDNDIERRLVAKLLQHAQARLQEMARTLAIRVREGLGPAAAAIEAGRGKRHMDEVRRVVSQLSAIEAKELHEMDDDLRDKIRRGIAFSAASIVLTLGLLVYLASMTTKAMRQQEQATKEADLARFEPPRVSRRLVGLSQAVAA